MNEDENNKNISYDNPNITNKKFIDGINKNVYYTQFNITVFLFFVIFFVLCSAIAICLFIIYLNGSKEFIYYTLIPIGILIIILIISSMYPLFTQITIDRINELIILKHCKILFCLNKTNYINLKEIEKVVIEKNTSVHYEINGVVYDGFNLVFIINKDKQIKGLIGEIDKNLESQKLFDFLREALPKNIPVSSDLMEINELYPNLNSQRIIGSSASYINLNDGSSLSSTALSFE